MQEPGEVIRSIWHELAAAEPDEQVEIFAFDFFGPGRFGGFGKRSMRQAERRGIGAQRRKFGQQRRIGRAHQQRGKKGIFLGPRDVDLVDIGAVCPIQIWSEDCAVDAGCGFN